MDKRIVWALVTPCVLAMVLLASGSAVGQDTPYEESGGRITPRYAETVAWLGDLAEGSSLLRLTSFGTSPQGRDLPLIIADRDGRFEPVDHAEREGRVVVLVQACIHAGESCGKDAGMILLRDLAAGTPETEGLLDQVTLVFIPIFNVDGHERFGAYNRINQNGPEEMGWRVTARNQNLNRDFLKADLPETQAWLGLFDDWRPDFFIDIHSTDGADYQYPITYGLETGGNMDPGLTTWTTQYRDAMVTAMADEGYPLGPYVSFRNWHDPASGLKAGSATPRFSQGLEAGRNVHCIPVGTLLIVGDIAQIDPYAQSSLPGTPELQLNDLGSTDCFDGAGKDAQAPITEILKKGSIVESQRTFHRRPVHEPEDPSSLLILMDGRRIPHQVGEHDSGQLAMPVCRVLHLGRRLETILPFQGDAELRCRIETVSRGFGKCFPESLRNLPRDRWPRLCHRDRIGHEVLAHDAPCGPPAEWRMPGQHLEKHTSQGVLVASSIYRLFP